MNFVPPIILIEGTLYNSDKRESDNNQNHVMVDPSTLTKGVNYNNLEELLRQCGIRDDKNLPMFWPEKLLRKILTKERISETLQTHNFQGLEDIILPEAGSGSPEYLKIFAILALISMEHEIDTFIKEGVCDQDLPLVECGGEQSWAVVLGRNKADPEPLEFLRRWRTTGRESFLYWQYAVNVAFLDLGPDGKIKHVDFDPLTVLPFRSVEPKGNGGYAQVSKVKIHPDCHGFHKTLRSITTDDFFAIKQLLKEDDKLDQKEERDFLNEVEMLKRFNGLIHPHWVTLLMTWTLRKKKNFLFPHAEHDLDSYWNDGSTWTSVTSDDFHVRLSTLQWISKQIIGMAGALDSLHNPQHLKEKKFARHGDLKPENVLWYRSPNDKKGILVIADFGLTAFNSANSCSNVPNKDIPRTPGYRPPECDLKDGTISRSFDIWTFGCLLLELVCWVLGGPNLRKEFEEERFAPYITGSQSEIFFDVKVKEDGTGYVVSVKEAVNKRIADLHKHTSCTKYLHDLLDLIENEMIIMLSETKSRIRSKPLLERIMELDGKVMDAQDAQNTYCMAHCPQPNRMPIVPIAVEAELNVNAIKLVSRHGTARLPTHKGPTQRSGHTLPQNL